MTLEQKHKYSKAGMIIRAGLLQGKGKARESEIQPREQGGQIGEESKCTKMIRLWAFVRTRVDNLQ